MKEKKKFPLYYQILIALAAGAIFGAIFNVDPYQLIVKHKVDGAAAKVRIEQWHKMRFTYPDSLLDAGYQEKVFDKEDQIQIIKYFKSLNKEKRRTLHLQKLDKNGDIVKEISGVVSIKKDSTIATEIKPIGDLFIRLLSFLAIPLVVASLILGAASLDDVKKIGRIGGQTLLTYVMTTAVAITIGLVAANVIEPGNQLDELSKNRLLGSYQEDEPAEVAEELEIDILDFFVQIVPKNPVEAMSKGEMLQIVFFAVIFGITLSLIKREKAEPVLKFFDGVSDVMIRMVELIMKIAPYGVFALIAATVADFGFNILSTLVWYIMAVTAGLLLQTILVYTFLVKVIGRESPIKYFSEIRNAQAIGFSTSSSAATLPVTMDCVEKGMGVPKQISGFVLPLGATINMDGTALYQGVAAVFIAQVYGFDLTIAQQLTVVMTAVLASIGTAPVPGVGIIMLVIILRAIHVPPEGIALILGVDRILDMMRTVTNVSGDAAVTISIAGSEKRRNNKKALAG